MPFSYYDRLSARDKKIYRASDAILRIDLPDIAALGPLAVAIEPVLIEANRAAVQRASQVLVDAINAQLKTPPIRVKVLERRPSNSYGELHGLYEPEEERERAVISVWMRTAQKVQVVKFRTFLRTLLHEVCHHLDYEHYKLAETFHTEGFYARESALLRELLGEKQP
ncbi:hypothetical protein [Usitatibacter palustris]|uniref:Uncharacterized protein n=1 Tax=Usitatibacter palustris TaxID=2732487 RepID=A0A6M4H3Y3_9PROT|nr:hypothetical protein [Usitatibacter palustris]QJR14289.1 hypothetical protein DSM104440_01082 [Usitatibacter palustris]